MDGFDDFDRCAAVRIYSGRKRMTVPQV